MTKQEHIEYWLKTAEYDLEAASQCLKPAGTLGVYFSHTLSLKKHSKLSGPETRRSAFLVFIISCNFLKAQN